MRNLTDKTTGRLPQKRVTRESMIGQSDIRAWRVRNPLVKATDAEVVAAILVEHPCDLGFLPRTRKA